jgi:predicted nucleic acid-binding protein
MLTREVKASILLADEEEIRELAVEFGFQVRECLRLLIEPVRLKLISTEAAKRDAERLMEEDYRVSEKVLKEFHSILKGIKRNGGCNT